MATVSFLQALRPLQRLRDFRRSIWQLRILARGGFSGFRLAEEVITNGKALQRKWELLALMGYVRLLRPAVVLEIGTYQGGTLSCWTRICPDDTVFISLDLPGGGFGGGYTEDDAQRFRSFLRDRQQLHCLRKDSHDPSTREEVVSLLHGRPIDFLFIDGDHTYEGVKMDFDLYSPLVRPGGLIAFHDVVEHTNNPDCRVHVFWREVKGSFQAKELIDHDGFDVWGGIGVLTQV